VQPIHLAAGAGNTDTIVELLKWKVDIDAPAMLNKKLHYMPIHDAAWFNRVDTFKCLLTNNACAHAQNCFGETVLHIAAKLGYDDIARLLLHEPIHELTVNPGPRTMTAVRKLKDSMTKDCLRLVKMKTHRGQLPLDVAVEKGQFPPSQLHLFTNCLNEEDQIKAFVKVAMACPAAAPSLVRDHAAYGTKEDCVMVAMRPEWSKILREGARRDAIDVRMLASLIDHAPQAAIDLLDALTEKPHVTSPEHYPLPLRASISQGNQFACRISCVYVEETKWSMDESSIPCTGSYKPWHRTLAPVDAKHGHEVAVRIFTLKGILDQRIFSELALTPAHQIFTKLVIHGLIKIAWSSYKWMFLLDLLQQCLVTAIISYWSSGESLLLYISYQVPSVSMRRLLWAVVASQGVTESIIFLWSSGRWCMAMGRRKLRPWLWKMWYKGFVGVLTVVLAIMTETEYGPEGNRSIILSANCLLHWMCLLYELRAFEWTGRRLLPIMKSMLPIFHMLVIMLFLCLAFVHAYWAMNRSSATEASFFGTVIFVFTGESELQEDLNELDGVESSFLLFLSLFAIFFSYAVMLNVFIAVLGDCYDKEQANMICNYLQERAQICSTFFLRPHWNLTFLLPDWSTLARPNKQNSSSAPHIFNRCCHRCCQRHTQTKNYARLGLQVGFVLIFCTLWCLLVYWVVNAEFSAWYAVAIMAAFIMSSQALLVCALDAHWGERYLWICHEATFEEGMFLADSDRRVVEHQGRVAEIKKYIRDQGKQTADKCAKKWEEHVRHQERAQERAKRNLESSLHSAADHHTNGVMPHNGEHADSQQSLLLTPNGNSPSTHALNDAMLSTSNWQYPNNKHLRHSCPSRLESVPESDSRPFSPQDYVAPHDGHQYAWQEMRTEMTDMRLSVERLNQRVDEQRDAQVKLQATADDIRESIRSILQKAASHRKPERNNNHLNNNHHHVSDPSAAPPRGPHQAHDVLPANAENGIPVSLPLPAVKGSLFGARHSVSISSNAADHQHHGTQLAASST
jgi:hypothetical protein